MNDEMKEENPLSPHKRRIQKNKGSYFRVHIGVLGEDKCGKTSLIQTFLTKNFQKEIKENTILQTYKVTITIENKPIELIITEINIYQKQEHKIIKDLVAKMDCFFICHEIKENDEFFNEETIKKFILYISNVHNLNDFLIYSVGCKLDKKSKEIKNKTAYIIDNEGKFTAYGQRVKTFVETHNIKKFFATSALLNYNINELFEDAITSIAFREFKKSKIKDIEHSSSNNINELYEEFYNRCFIF